MTARSTAKTNAKSQATQQQPAQTIDRIEQLNQSLGQYGIPDFDPENHFKRCYYGLQQALGFQLSQQAKERGEEFSWTRFKHYFGLTFGIPEDPKATLEELLDFAERKLGKDRTMLIIENKESWKRRESYSSNGNSNNSYYPQPQVRTQYPAANPVPQDVSFAANRRQPQPVATPVAIVEDYGDTNYDDIPYQ